MTSIFRLTSAASALALCLAAPLAAQEAFGPLDTAFDARVQFSGVDRGPVTAGSTVTVSGERFEAGQTVILRQNGVPLNAVPFEADDEGRISAEVNIPEDVEPAVYPVVIEVANPAYADVTKLKVSPVLEETGNLEITTTPMAPGLYQVAHSADGNVLYVTSAVGRPPVKESALLKVDAATGEILAQATPPAAPAREDGSDGGVFAVYGVGVDDATGQVWVTNTRQNTIAVYDGGDLSLVKQFDPGQLGHPRDVVVHDGKAYVSATFLPEVHVFDTATLEPAGIIEIPSHAGRGSEFGTASLSLDPEAAEIVVTSLTSNEVATIDLASGEVASVHQVPGSDSSIGVSHDPETDRIFVAGQGSDTVTILDGQSGDVVAQVRVGANPLNVAFDPVSGLAWVAVRASGTVVALDADGEIVANAAVGPLPNHLIADGKGGAWMVNKGNGDDGNQLIHISLSE
ncbi:beta-propeller fold lactonase family protein [Mangrovicoccus algicola]|uniref:ATP-binding protein n=1 Tax=Mangrovicoccus algicola TaxID=2771008 RepID=A0A8J6YTC1_9RHOB|nr:ATP-binding protein [Mangrovicoccus algicola]MBE3637270.1 ATP-binding protein [Mangrovicoccus algicola]